MNGPTGMLFLDAHPTAVIDQSARLVGRISVGPHSVIGANVTVHEGTRLANHVTLTGPAEIGKFNRIASSVVIGGLGVELSTETAGAPSDRAPDSPPTILGSHCHLHAGAQIGAGAVVDDRVTIGQKALVAAGSRVFSDVMIGDGAFVGGRAVLWNFASVAPLSRVERAVPPYCAAEGNPARAVDIAVEHLEARRVQPRTIKALQWAWRLLAEFKEDQVRELLRERRLLVPAVNYLLSFLQDENERTKAIQRKAA